jgi:hypothetical protein
MVPDHRHTTLSTDHHVVGFYPALDAFLAG